MAPAVPPAAGSLSLSLAPTDELRPAARRAADAVLLVLVAVVDLLVWSGDSTLWNGRSLPVWVVPVSTLLIYPSLLLRHRRPLMVLCIQWIYAFACLPLPGYQPFAALLLALFAAARRTATRTAVLLLIGTLLPFAGDGIQVARVSLHPVSVGFTSIVLWIVIATTVWGFARMLLQVERRGDLLRRAEAEQAVHEERLRLARDLHDVVSHAVTAMLLQAAGARTLAAPGDTRMHETLRLIEDTGVSAMNELHQLLGVLRSAGGEADSQAGAGMAQLDGLVQLSRRSGLEVAVLRRGRTDNLAPSVDQTAFRIVQESLTNARKHAGRGARCELLLDRTFDCLQIEIRDTVGAPTGLVHGEEGPTGADGRRLAGGLGLLGLTERVHALGGTIDWSDEQDGFVVRARIPLVDTVIRV